MKKNTIMALALAIGAAPLSQASDFSLASHMKDAFKVFDAKRDYAENPYLQELTQDENPEIARMATDLLNRKARFMYEDEDLRSWNYEKMRATEILKTYQKTEKQNSIR